MSQKMKKWKRVLMIFAVVALVTIGLFTQSETVEASTLKKPTVTSVSVSTKGVVVKWKKASNVSGYQIYRKSGSGSYKKIKTISGNSTVKFTDTTVKNGVTYTYKIRTYKGSKRSSFSKAKSIKYLKAPTLTISRTGTNDVKVSWKRNSAAKYYYILRKSGSGSWYIVWVVMSNSQVSWTDTNVFYSTGEKYTYAVRAMDKYGNESAYNTKSITNCSHTWVKKSSTATCTSGGTAKYRCSKCGTTKTSKVSAAGHSYTSKVTKAATCTAAGTRKYTCSKCGHTCTKTIAALGHSYQGKVTEPTYKDRGYTTYTCSRCKNSYVGNYTDAKTDTCITVAGTDYWLGENASNLGTPDEVLTSTSDAGYQWYVYGTSTYQNFFAAGVLDNKVVVLMSAGPGFVYQGIRCGSILSSYKVDTDGDGTMSYTFANCTAKLAYDLNDNNVIHAVQIASSSKYESLGNYGIVNFVGESKLNFHLTNAFRVYHGLSPLIWDDRAAVAAKLYSQEMAETDICGHFGPSNNSSYTCAVRMKNQGVSASSYGENCVMGTDWAYASGFEAYTCWVFSSGHRANMLKSWTHLGVGGADRSTRGHTYFTQDFWK